MIKKTITYTDYNGVERTEDKFFALREPDILELEVNTPGGLEEYIKTIMNAKDQKQILDMFKKLILMSYGEKDADGIHFYKNDKIRDEFEASAAYAALYMELAIDADKASEFVNGIMPKDLDKTIARINAKANPQKELAAIQAATKSE